MLAVEDKLGTNANLLSALTDSASSNVLKDFDLIGLWSDCEGENTNGIAKITHCSSPTSWVSFNPSDVWGLKNTLAQNVLGDILQKGLNTCRKGMRWMVCSFVLATLSTAV
jgi:hypothetical protein